MEATLYRTQHDDRPSNYQEESALYHAGYGMHERGTNKGWIREKSYYVKATKNPVLTYAIAVGVGAAIWSAWNKK